MLLAACCSCVEAKLAAGLLLLINCGGRRPGYKGEGGEEEEEDDYEEDSDNDNDEEVNDNDNNEDNDCC